MLGKAWSVSHSSAYRYRACLFVQLSPKSLGIFVNFWVVMFGEKCYKFDKK
ncbi:MAG: hypothetical protein IM477_08980 [Microcystis sp. M090S1]|nr:hypothetical protein [Microcystis sp. M090S1]